MTTREGELVSIASLSSLCLHLYDSVGLVNDDLQSSPASNPIRILCRDIAYGTNGVTAS